MRRNLWRLLHKERRRLQCHHRFCARVQTNLCEMEHRALRLPRAEPLLHVPISAIVEFVSNRSEVTP